MTATVLKTEKHKSKYGGFFYYLFMKGEDGKSYRTCVAEKYSNYQRWKNFITRSLSGERFTLTGLSLMRNGFINADCEPKEVIEKKEI